MLTTANLITLFRIALIPAFVVSFIYMPGHPAIRWAGFLIFTLAAVLDAVDGFVARVFRQKTQLGAFLDPLADKLLMTIVYILGVGYGIPHYVTVLVVSRDVLIVLGWAALFYFDRDTDIRPIWISKFNTACQFVTACLFLLTLAQSPENAGLDGILKIALNVTVGTTLISGGACFADWYKRMGGFTRV